MTFKLNCGIIIKLSVRTTTHRKLHKKLSKKTSEKGLTNERKCGIINELSDENG